MIHEENDHIIVDELRPMSDAPRDECFLGLHKLDGKFVEGYYDTIGNIWCGEVYFSSNDFAGWIPMPIYRPKDGA